MLWAEVVSRDLVETTREALFVAQAGTLKMANRIDREQARRVQAVLDAVPEGVVLRNGDGRILMTNLWQSATWPVLSSTHRWDVTLPSCRIGSCLVSAWPMMAGRLMKRSG